MLACLSRCQTLPQISLGLQVHVTPYDQKHNQLQNRLHICPELRNAGGWMTACIASRQGLSRTADPLSRRALIETCLLKQIMAVGPAPPVRDMMRGGERAVFHLSNALLVSSNLCPFMRPVSRSQSLLSVKRGMWVEYSNIEIGSLKPAMHPKIRLWLCLTWPHHQCW